MTSIIFFFIFVPILSVILLSVNFILAPHKPYKEKKTPFECGYHSFLAQNRSQFTISFFIFGLLFLIFDLEIVLIYPITVSSYFNEVYGISIVVIFVLVLTLGFIFELGKNALKIDTRQEKDLVLNYMASSLFNRFDWDKLCAALTAFAAWTILFKLFFYKLGLPIWTVLFVSALGAVFANIIYNCIKSKQYPFIHYLLLFLFVLLALSFLLFVVLAIKALNPGISVNPSELYHFVSGSIGTAVIVHAAAEGAGYATPSLGFALFMQASDSGSISGNVSGPGSGSGAPAPAPAAPSAPSAAVQAVPRSANLVNDLKTGVIPRIGIPGLDNTLNRPLAFVQPGVYNITGGQITIGLDADGVTRKITDVTPVDRTGQLVRGYKAEGTNQPFAGNLARCLYVVRETGLDRVRPSSLNHFHMYGYVQDHKFYTNRSTSTQQFRISDDLINSLELAR